MDIDPSVKDGFLPLALSGPAGEFSARSDIFQSGLHRGAGCEDFFNSQNRLLSSIIFLATTSLTQCDVP